MSASGWVYLVAVVLNALSLFLEVFFTIMYSDLEVDYINPIDLCSRLNPFIGPKIILHGVLSVLLLVTGHWITFLLNVPLLAFNINTVIKNQYTLDATEIFRTLNRHKKESFAKLGFHLIIFFVYLYCMIVAMLGDN